MIKVKNLKFDIGNQVIFDSLSFEAGAGEKVCIAGGSGTGKSTLFKILMGFAKPAGGDVWVDGMRLDSETVWDIRKRIAYVSQEPDLGNMPVIDRIKEPFSYKRNSNLSFDKEKLEYWFDRFELDKTLLTKNSALLSGGEKQRVAIIISLMLERPVFILDEPVSALDKKNKRVLAEVLGEFKDKTVLFSSHDEILMNITDKTINVRPD